MRSLFLLSLFLLPLSFSWAELEGPSATSIMSSHTSASDPHPQYATDSDLSTGLAGKENSLGFTPVNKAGDTMSGNLDLNNNRMTNVPTAPSAGTDAINQNYATSLVGGLPSGVYVTPLNKTHVYQTKEGLVVQQLDSATQTNSAGAYNGGGTGQKSFIELFNYNGTSLSAISFLKFTAKNIRDGGPSGQQGNLSFNVLTNFNNGFLTAANDYAILLHDSLPAWFTQFFVISNSAFTEYSASSTDRAWKAVGGTGVISFTGDVGPVGSFTVRNVSGSNINALTVGQYIRKTPTGVTAISESNMTFPDGATITAINVAGNSFTVSQPSGVSLTAISFKQYGGVAPDSRSATCNGTSVVAISFRSSDGVTTTADLQVNMKVTDDVAHVPANSYIVSMIANTSINLNNNCTAGSSTLSFKATGKTGIPNNSELVGIPLTKIVENNPSAFISNNAPLTPIWAANDGGAPKNYVLMGGIQLNQGSSSINTHRLNVIQNVKVNSDVYLFAQ